MEKDYKKLIDTAINELVYDKRKLVKAYNYYHGKRDPEQYKHLEENFGIGTASSVEFVPLVRKHVDVLIGEYLSTPVKPRISCKDQKTLSNIFKEKKEEVENLVTSELKNYLGNLIYGSDPEQLPSNSDLEKKIKAGVENIEQNFISDYEVAAQNIVDWLMQARNIDFTNKRKILLTDLLVAGVAYFRSIPTNSKTGVNLEILNPLNTFIEKSPESPYLKDSRRSVVRTYLSKDQILSKFGKLLTKDDLDSLDVTEDYFDDVSAIFMETSRLDGDPYAGDGILGGLEIMPVIPNDIGYSRRYKFYPVYEVEWIKTEKEGDEFVQNRYSGARIGSTIHIYYGKDENVIRSMGDPNKCHLTVNGMFYSDRNGEPFSLMLATASLQDKFDVLNFYKDNLIAESGTRGDWVDIAYVPTIFGANLTERLMKWKAYKKQGLAIIDSSQEGEGPMNTTFGGYDDTVSFQAIQAIEMAIQSVEATCSTITGVFREKIGDIEQKDAVTNVQTGIRQSSYITKQFYHLMDLLTREMLIDMIDVAKVVFKKGLTGTLVLGEKLNNIFTALPEHYSFTEHDVHIADSSEIISEQELLKQLTFEFAKNDKIDPEIVVEVLTSTGLTNMKQSVQASLSKRRSEQEQMAQMNNQLEEMDQQLKQAVKEAEKLAKEVERLNQEKLALEKAKLEHQKEIEWFKAKSEDKYKEDKIEWEKKRVQLEGLQLIDTNPTNNEVRDK